MAAGEVGVRGRRRERDATDEAARTATVMETPTLKRRKMEEEESRIVLSPCVTQATTRGGIGASETSVVIVRRRDSPVEEQCQILSSVLNSASVSSCSGNTRSEEKSKRRIEFVDFAENNGGGDQIETSWIYDNFINKRNDPYSSVQQVEESVNSTAMENHSSVVESRRRLKTTTVKEAEIEDFFQTAEKDLHNKVLECSRKYNFDFEKDEPLGGKYECVKVNP